MKMGNSSRKGIMRTLPFGAADIKRIDNGKFTTLKTITTMKQTFKTFVLASALALASTAAFAQSTQQSTQQRGNRLSPEAMIEQRANRIAQQMGLDTKLTKKFVSVYKSEQSAMREVMPQRGNRPPRGERPQGEPPRGERPQGNPPSMDGNNAQAPGRPQMSDEDKEKMEKIKTKYEKKYAKFFSQEQIAQMRKFQQQDRPSRRSEGKQKDSAN